MAEIDPAAQPANLADGGELEQQIMAIIGTYDNSKGQRWRLFDARKSLMKLIAAHDQALKSQLLAETEPAKYPFGATAAEAYGRGKEAEKARLRQAINTVYKEVK